MTKHNVGEEDDLSDELSIAKAEFDEMVQLSKFYRKVQEESIAKGEEKGMEKGKILTTMKLIRSGLVSLEAVVQTLELTPEEVAEIQLLLRQSSNGNGSNGFQA